MNTFDEFAESLSPHPSKAKILLEVANDDNVVRHALDTLKDHGVEPIEHEILSQEHTVRMQILLPSEYLQESVLMLSEAGFTQVRGISAQTAPSK